MCTDVDTRDRAKAGIKSTAKVIALQFSDFAKSERAFAYCIEVSNIHGITHANECVTTLEGNWGLELRLSRGH